MCDVRDRQQYSPADVLEVHLSEVTMFQQNLASRLTTHSAPFQTLRCAMACVCTSATMRLTTYLLYSVFNPMQWPTFSDIIGCHCIFYPINLRNDTPLCRRLLGIQCALLDSSVDTIWAEGNVVTALHTACAEIAARIEQYQECRSGLVLVAIQTRSTTIGRYVSRTVGCESFFNTQGTLKRKVSVLREREPERLRK